MSQVLVGVDAGTTSSKAVVVDEAGREVGHGRAATTWSFTANGTEIDAFALVDSAADAVTRALSTVPDARVAGVGVASMGESGVLLDGKGLPLAPLIAWHDRRGADELAALAASPMGGAFARRTGLPLSTLASLIKHRWLIDHELGTRRAVRRLNVAEWIVRTWGADEASEQSLASRTGWLDLATRSWWTDTVAWAGAKESLLPPLVTAGTSLGEASGPRVPAQLVGAVLTVAGHDHQAAAVGAAATAAGDELDSCGTAEALIRTIAPGLEPSAVETLVAAGITVGWHVLADRWCLLGATVGGLVLQRTLAALGIDQATLPELDRQALTAGPGTVTVTHQLGSVAISGIEDTASPAAIWRAAVDAVAAEALTIHRAMARDAGPHAELVLTGGWSRSLAVREAKRRAFDSFVIPAVGEAGARGAALFAGLAAGIYAAPSEFPTSAVEPGLRLSTAND